MVNFIATDLWRREVAKHIRSPADSLELNLVQLDMKINKGVDGLYEVTKQAIRLADNGLKTCLVGHLPLDDYKQVPEMDRLLSRPNVIFVGDTDQLIEHHLQNATT